MKKDIKNTEASIRARLLNYAKKEGISFERVLIYYFQERFLYRLSISKHKENLILKGGALLLALNMTKGRPTKDIDFLAMTPELSHKTAVALIREIVGMPADDAVIFDPVSIAALNIREEDNLNALRIKCITLLGSAN